MAQYVYTMNRVGTMIPPKRVILKDIGESGEKAGELVEYLGQLSEIGVQAAIGYLVGVDKMAPLEAMGRDVLWRGPGCGDHGTVNFQKVAHLGQFREGNCVQPQHLT